MRVEVIRSCKAPACLNTKGLSRQITLVMVWPEEGNNSEFWIQTMDYSPYHERTYRGFADAAAAADAGGDRADGL